VLWQGLVAAEFLHLYGAACEARPMGLQELFISLAWPLDNPELAKLLQQLLLVRPPRHVPLPRLPPPHPRPPNTPPPPGLRPALAPAPSQPW
jgi:hypothetical protein